MRAQTNAIRGEGRREEARERGGDLCRLLAAVFGREERNLLGGIWYSSRAFGARWAEGVGIDLESEDAGKHAVKAFSCS